MHRNGKIKFAVAFFILLVFAIIFFLSSPSSGITKVSESASNPEGSNQMSEEVKQESIPNESDTFQKNKLDNTKVISRTATTDTYQLGSNSYSLVSYSTDVNMKDSDGLYQPYEEVTTVTSDDNQLIIAWNNKKVYLQFYTKDDSGKKEKLIDKKDDDRQLLNLHTNITKERGFYYFTHSLNKDHQPSKLGYEIKTENINCNAEGYSLTCGEQKIDFSDVVNKQNLTLEIHDSNVEISGEDLSYVDPGVEIVMAHEGRGVIERYNFDIGGGEYYDWETNLEEIGSVWFGGVDGKKTRGWAYFNISPIPAGADINNIDIEYYLPLSGIVMDDCVSYHDLVYREITDGVDLTPDNEADEEDTWADLGASTIYTHFYIDDETEDVGWHGVDLGGAADADLQEILDGVREGNPDGHFPIAIMSTEEDFDDDCNAEFSDSGSTKPRLTVYYTTNETETTGWPQCNPAEPCCDITGHFRSYGYVCKAAHDIVCENVAGCEGIAVEDKCDGMQAYCPNSNDAITYDAACNDLVCVSQNCFGSTFQPERTCSAGTCQTNNIYGCPNNLNCLDSTSCKTDASSSGDCKNGYEYDQSDDVCWFNNGNPAISFVYDNNGNLINDSEFIYGYDTYNNLVNVSYSGQLLARYFYDDQGIRIKTIEYAPTGNTTTYYFDNFVQIVNSSGRFNETYYYYYDRLVGKKAPNGQIFYYHPDLLGSTSLITNSTGGVVANLEYEPFGELKSDSGERYTYTGHELDQETQLLYMKARYQNPDLAGFIQPDPVIQDVYNPQNLNKYSYVGNNPYTYMDPNGEFLIETAIILGMTAPIWAPPLIEYIYKTDEQIKENTGIQYTDNPLGYLVFPGSIAGRIATEGNLLKEAENLKGFKDLFGSIDTSTAIKEIPQVSSLKLQNIVNDFYKHVNTPGHYGGGTTADAIRYELETGREIRGKTHIIKGNDLVTRLNNWIRNNHELATEDLNLANKILDDLKSALGVT